MSFACGWRARRFGDSEVGYAPGASPSLGDGDRFYQAAQRAASKGQCLSAPVSLDGDRDSRLIVLIPLLAGGLWLAGARIASSIGMVNNLQEPLAPLPKHAYLYSTVAGTRNNDGERTRTCPESAKKSRRYSADRKRIGLSQWEIGSRSQSSSPSWQCNGDGPAICVPAAGQGFSKSLFPACVGYTAAARRMGWIRVLGSRALRTNCEAD